jgi:hypothetical protein
MSRNGQAELPGAGWRSEGRATGEGVAERSEPGTAENAKNTKIRAAWGAHGRRGPENALFSFPLCALCVFCG